MVATVASVPEGPPPLLADDAQPPVFAGWLKDSLPWREIATGATYGACLVALLRVPAVGGHAERVVLPAGRSPYDRITRGRKCPAPVTEPLDADQ